MENEIDVSVIIICHNQLDLLKRAISSVLKQDFKGNYEIIVSDDDSQDGTESYVLALKEKYPKLNYIKVNNHSPLLTRMDGVKISNGEYICFLDGDDYYHTSYITKMYDAAKKYQADIINCAVFYDRGNKRIVKSKIKTNKIYDSSLKAIKGLFNDFYIHGFMHTKLYKASLLKNLSIEPFKHLTIYEDTVLNYFVFKEINKLCTIKENLLYYNKANQGSLTNSDKRIENGINSVKVIKEDAIKDEKLLKAFKKSYLRRKALLFVDVRKTKFKTKEMKRLTTKRAYKDLKEIYFK